MVEVLSRRGLLRRVTEQRLVARRRPPGAIPEREFLKRCTGCRDCVDACPHNAVHTLAGRGRAGDGTPVMVPDQRPCHMCEGFPCAAACTEGALVAPAAPTWPLGLVTVDPSQCLPFRGPECGACGGLCPEGAVGAITFERNRPSIDPMLCVGCGLCLDACPTRPAALTLLPLE